MAIIIDKEPNLIDLQNEKFVGIRLPLEKSNGREGYFESTSLTLPAIKENLRLLLNTRKGERIFQPNIGMELENFLFDNITEETIISLQENITQTINNIMPFIGIQDMDIRPVDLGNSYDYNKLKIEIHFYLIQNPNMLDSVSFEIDSE
tara:strand:- start:6299 stop:6745 length:447 start_codon:yes stop_codon:yes gene_type:complete